MLKTKTKEELLEYAYSLTSKIQHLEDENKYLSNTLDSVEEVIYSNPIKRLFTIDKLKDYFYKTTMNTMKYTKEQLTEALAMINKYQAKELNSNDYVSYVKSLTKMKTCSTCGNITKRLHQDFQRVILEAIKDVCPELLPNIKFTSGRYASGQIEARVPYMTYKELRYLEMDMIGECTRWKQRGYSGVEAMYVDIDLLRHFIAERGLIGREEMRVEIEPIEETPTPIALDEIKVKEETVQSVEEVVVEEPIIEAKEEELTPQVKKEFSIDEALTLRNEGMSVTKIAKTLGFSRSYVSTRLNKYDNQ